MSISVGTARNGVKIELHDSKLLTPDTVVRGQYETALKDLFIKHGLRAFYEPVELPVPGLDYSYRPDFVVELEINGRSWVVFEPHKVTRNVAYFNQKMAAFTATYGDLLPVILIKSPRRFSGQAVVDYGEDVPNGWALGQWSMPQIPVSPVAEAFPFSVEIGHGFANENQVVEQRHRFYADEMRMNIWKALAWNEIEKLMDLAKLVRLSE